MGGFNIQKNGCTLDGDYSKLEALIAKLEKPGYVDVGILGSETVADEEMSIADIGAVHEFGSLENNNPERSFIRMPIQEKQKKIAKDVYSKFDKNIENFGSKEVLETIGIGCESAIQEAFNTGGFGQWEDIQQSTKDRKGSDAILIDDGTLRKAITSKVGGV